VKCVCTCTCIRCHGAYPSIYPTPRIWHRFTLVPGHNSHVERARTDKYEINLGLKVPETNTPQPRAVPRDTPCQ
jgi:hypothetical protein